MDNRKKEMKFRCVECGFPIKTLYIQYSPGNIRLMKCVNCKAIADEYIECELMIIVIDLILHKSKAYRHLFYNMFNRDALNVEGLLWRSALAYFLFDTYKTMVSMRSQKDRSSTINSAVFSWSSGEMLMNLFFGNFMFICMLLLGTKKLLKTSTGVSRCKDILLGTLVSSYFKIFLIATMVWEFPSLVIVIIDIFVLSSNTVALKESDMVKCFGVCFTAHAIKFLASQGLDIRFPELEMSWYPIHFYWRVNFHKMCKEVANGGLSILWWNLEKAQL